MPDESGGPHGSMQPRERSEFRLQKNSKLGRRPGIRKLDFAPFQLVAEDFEIGFFGWLDEFEALRGAGDADAIIGLHRNTFLAVKSVENGFGISCQLEFDAGRISDDDRPIGERVRADGGDDESFDGGVNDGTTSGKGIGGGAGRRGYDKAVSAVAADEIAVDEEFQFDHAGQRAFVDDGIVEDVLAIQSRAGADVLDLEHDALTHRGSSS